MKELIATLGVLMIAFGVAKLAVALWQRRRQEHE